MRATAWCAIWQQISWDSGGYHLVDLFRIQIFLGIVKVDFFPNNGLSELRLVSDIEGMATTSHRGVAPDDVAVFAQ